MARPEIIWDDKQYKQFEVMCGLQCTQQEICDIFDIDHKTLDKILRRYYGEGYSQVYNKYSSTGKLTLRRHQFKIAEKNAYMAVFLGKVYLGQRDDNKKIDDDDEDDNLFKAIESAVSGDEI